MPQTTNAAKVRPILVGRFNDSHISAVNFGLQRREISPILIEDIELSRQWPWFAAAATPFEDPRARGLIRCLPRSPVAGRSAQGNAWSEFTDGLVSDPRVEWLSRLAEIRQADNKLYQLALADRIGVKHPRTVVARTTADIGNYIGEEIVLKPLGSGVIDNGDGPRVFYATLVKLSDLVDSELAHEPMIAQQPLPADEHLRVVTVGARIWCGSLSAVGLPLDWRESPALRWRECDVPSVIARDALGLARISGIGFSSQDWIRAGDDFWFLDLNPNGKWLFLPNEVADPVTEAIVTWLTNGNDDSYN